MSFHGLKLKIEIFYDGMSRGPLLARAALKYSIKTPTKGFIFLCHSLLVPKVEVLF